MTDLLSIAMDRFARGLDGTDAEMEAAYLQGRITRGHDPLVLVIPEGMLRDELAALYASALANGWHERVRARLLGPDEAKVPLAVRKLTRTRGACVDLDFDGVVSVPASGRDVATESYQRYRARLDDALG